MRTRRVGRSGTDAGRCRSLSQCSTCSARARRHRRTAATARGAARRRGVVGVPRPRPRRAPPDHATLEYQSVVGRLRGPERATFPVPHLDPPRWEELARTVEDDATGQGREECRCCGRPSDGRPSRRPAGAGRHRRADPRRPCASRAGRAEPLRGDATAGVRQAARTCAPGPGRCRRRPPTSCQSPDGVTPSGHTHAPRPTHQAPGGCVVNKWSQSPDMRYAPYIPQQRPARSEDGWSAVPAVLMAVVGAVRSRTVPVSAFVTAHASSGLRGL